MWHTTLWQLILLMLEGIRLIWSILDNCDTPLYGNNNDLCSIFGNTNKLIFLDFVSVMVFSYWHHGLWITVIRVQMSTLPSYDYILWVQLCMFHQPDTLLNIFEEILEKYRWLSKKVQYLIVVMDLNHTRDLVI